MRRSNFDLPKHPAGAIFIHDDSAWFAGKSESTRIAFIRREEDGSWSLIAQPDPLSVKRRIYNGHLLTTARRTLKRYADTARRQNIQPQENDR